MVSFNFQYITRYEQLPAIALEIAAAPALSEDLETTGFSPILNDIRLWSINTGKSIYVIDVFQTGRPEPIIQAHKDNPTAVVIGQNLKFDQTFLLYHYGLEFGPVFDCFRASKLMHNGHQLGTTLFDGHNLWDLYRRELNVNPETEDLGGSDWSTPVLTPAQLEYAAEDVYRLPMLREVMKPKLLKMGLGRVAAIEFQVILAEAAIELNGFYLDADAWNAVAEENRLKRDTRQEILWSELPDPFDQMTLPGLQSRWNLDSPQQMLASLRRLGVTQKVRDEETNRERTVRIQDTSEITLAMASDAFPQLAHILEYREAATQLKMFGPEFLKFTNPETGRLHPSYYPFLLSGRYSCSRPNLSQIPRDKRFRRSFQAPSGRVLVVSDYSNIEMRIVAEISGDEVLIKVFIDGKDAHRYTASLLANKAEADVTKGERQMAKPVNFGLIYGMQPPKLVLYARAGYGVTMTAKQSQAYREKYFERFSGVARWHARAQRDGQRQKAAWSRAGRLRYLDTGDFYNEYYNHPVQATGADGLKAALRCVYDRFRRLIGRPPARIKGLAAPAVCTVHHVHDELVTEAQEDPDFVVAVTREQEEGMREGMRPLLPRVPIELESGTGSSWAEKS
jgi:DNA polymerase-1